MTLSGRSAAICAGFVLALGCMTAPALAQNAPPFDVTAQNYPSTVVIDSWVDAQAKDLASGDRDKVVAARQALSLTGSAPNKSAAFLQIYGKAINAKLMPVAEGRDAHAKLNAAMVANRVADMGSTAEVIPLVVRLIGDDSAGVALYGVRAASSMIPKALADTNRPGRDRLVPALLGAMKKHADSEAVVAECYQAMVRVLAAGGQNAQLPQNVVVAATPPVIEGLVQLLEQRAPAFGAGDIVEPMAEGPAISFLARPASWAAMNPQTQARAVKVILAIANGAVKELEFENNRKPTQSRVRIQAIQALLKTPIAQSLSVIASQVQNPTLNAEVDKLKALGVLSPPAAWEVAVSGVTKAYSTAFKLNGPATQPAK
jgi:hypothetical protein